MKISTQTARSKLTPRPEPYWQTLAKGQALGFRRTESGGNWIARRTEGTRKQYHAIGAGPAFDRPEKDQSDVLDYDAALEAAMAWFTTVASGANARYTVQDAVDAYVSRLRIEKPTPTASADAERVLEKLPAKLLATRLSKLRTPQIKAWRDSLVKDGDADAKRRSQDTANRKLSMLKAALNMAFTDGEAASDDAWRRVKPFKLVGEARKLFLSDGQVARLLKHTTGGFHKLCKAAALTGARYGELAAAHVADFNAKDRTLRLSGKTGSRITYLSQEATAFFKSVTQDRLPGAHLLVKDDGTPWGKSHQHRHMKDAVKAAKLPRDCVFYSLRHYHISKALVAGVPILAVAQNCGTSVRMVEQHYGKFCEQDRQALFDRVRLV